MFYHHLSVVERATIQIGHAQGFGQRRTARFINRPPSTISRELAVRAGYRNRHPDRCAGILGLKGKDNATF